MNPLSELLSLPRQIARNLLVGICLAAIRQFRSNSKSFPTHMRLKVFCINLQIKGEATRRNFQHLKLNIFWKNKSWLHVGTSVDWRNRDWDKVWSFAGKAQLEYWRTLRLQVSETTTSSSWWTWHRDIDKHRGLVDYGTSMTKLFPLVWNLNNSLSTYPTVQNINFQNDSNQHKPAASRPSHNFDCVDILTSTVCQLEIIPKIKRFELFRSWEFIYSRIRKQKFQYISSIICEKLLCILKDF